MYMRNIFKSLCSFCYVVVVFYCGIVSVHGMESASVSALFYKYIGSSGVELWKDDGERFLTEGFLDAYKETGVAPDQNDGKPCLRDWLAVTFHSNVFDGYWGIEKFEIAEPLVERMRQEYIRLGVGEEESAVCNLNFLKAILEILSSPY